MERATFEVADIFRRHGERYAQEVGVPLAQRRVMQAITACRTAALGGHLEQCDGCRSQRIAYNSCRNRHCPKCQSLARAQWIEQRQTELLSVEYFHVVFTVPQEIAAIALQNKAALYNLLFAATSETLQTIAADPKHLGAKIGFFAILHTWGQNLTHHPHLHCVIPGGGRSSDGERWIGCRPGFFLPVRVLSRYFRRCYLDGLQRLFDRAELRFSGSLTHLRERNDFLAYLQPLREKEWVVYAKAPFAGPQQVLDYVGRYTHRVALSNNRLLNIDDGQVTFRWKDYREGDAQKTMTLDASEFMRRFLLHVLPLGLKRIRYYGFLGPRHREANLIRCRELLRMRAPAPQAPPPKDHRDRYEALTGHSLHLCRQCQRGRMVTLRCIAPLPPPPGTDTS